MNSPRSPIDPAISLCLACSSSLPPRKPLASPLSPNFKPSSGSSSGDEIFVTQCCQRPICPSCVRANPRLTRYNPCLHCLGGVGAVSARSRKFPAEGERKGTGAKVNVDGAVRDEDVFVLGDDEDDEDSASTASDSPPPATPPPAYRDVASPLSAPTTLSPSQSILPTFKSSEPTHAEPTESLKPPQVDPSPSTNTGPQRYYIQPTDTLLGIALRFHIDARALCRLNNLPPSALRTTPHLLHTRTFLVLPAGARGPGSSTAPPADDARSEGGAAVNRPSAADEARRARERAESRFRVLTKEADYRVARAYVAVAGLGDSDAADAFREDEMKKVGAVDGAADKLRKRHPSSSTEGAAGGSGVEGRAVDRYLDDEEWEERQRREGRGIEIPAFPLFGGGAKSGDGSGKKTWWRW
ncbi:uncharacterized protein C8Q71DRAFT_527835 [Rhodofomes roseus]|uniref:LysM domain-containing protein n=1 Tax=Rhodofomes roseus TaxID=34475 RepID=A0ABQ8KJS4_9APHY|nr:uncharacterized protein C8Q71DRAFT_527835 [Rhodofomes roseus]KAH9838399.1 hypothetical protein C8Q71DRAFT_527835 [Rhodofomes roseus]